MQEGRDLLPGGFVSHRYPAHDINQQTLAMFAEVLGACSDADSVGHRDRPVLGDPVLHVHRTDGREREVETGDQLHHRRIGQHERIGERHRVAVAQAGNRGVCGDVGAVDSDIVDGERPVRQPIPAGYQR
jgi:hypothetical protein